MPEIYTEEIPLENLMINIENPRFDIVNNQREAIEMMITNQKGKLINLSKDISIEGLNPADRIMVTNLDGFTDQYKVLEGNRRVTGLKLLTTPEIVKNIDKSIYKTMNKLSKSFDSSEYKNIDCVVFEDEEEAYKWIELKHTGENEGVGVVGWDGQAIARFNKRMGKTPSKALQAIEYIKNESESEELIENADEIAITNLDRLLSDPEFREAIGLDVHEGLLTSNLPKKEVNKGLEKVMKDLIKKDIQVGDIYYKENRREYLETFSDEDLPDLSKSQKERKMITNLDKEDKIDASKNGKSKTKRKKEKKSFHRRKLIPRGCKLDIDTHKIKDIYLELKSIDVNYFPHCSGVMLRVFLELSMDKYIDAIGLNTVTENDKLVTKLSKISKYMRENKIMTKNDLHPIQLAISKENSILSITTLHQYVHNLSLSPTSDDLKIHWNNIQIFIERLWEEINKVNS